MKKKLVILGIMATVIIANTILTGTGCSGLTSKEKGANTITDNFARLPFFIKSVSQDAADTFSWRSFIAMCWPADTNTCGPDTIHGKNILTGGGPLVWETYLSSEQVFVTAPAQPDQWCSYGIHTKQFGKLPKQVQDLAQKTGVYRFMQRIEKAPHGIKGIGEAFGGPLVDQNGRFVRYEVRMNQVEYNYIITNTLWDSAGQRRFMNAGGATFFPNGDSSHVGSMEIKAAWKIMGKGDDVSRFYTIRAIVYNTDTGGLSPGPNPVTLGLVGLHIARKAPAQNNWVWSTFEQVDNLTKSFHNPKCMCCPVNRPIQDSLNEFEELDPVTKLPLHRPTEVTRVNAVNDSGVAAINAYYQNLLKGSVWANYKLISTQWLSFENPTPNFLANSTLETYLQGPSPASFGFKPPVPLPTDYRYFADPRYHPFSDTVSSSCMGCHYTANLLNNPKPNADFSFMLGEAH